MPRPRLAPPELRKSALRLIDILGPAYVRLGLGLGELRFSGASRLAEALGDFYSGRARLILAFRHPYGDEPQLLTYALRSAFPREAKRLGLSLPRKPHCFFLHGYEVPLWSGALVRWILPRTGSMPVYHVRMDGAGLRAIRRTLAFGEHPVALAPEGQVSYRGESLPRLERGALQLGFWCAEELEAAGRGERVLVLPLSFHVDYPGSEIARLEGLCADLERKLSLPEPPVDATSASASAGDPAAARRRALGLRLRALDLSLLSAAEGYYGIGGGRAASSPAPGRESRRAALLEEALRRAEAALALRPEGDAISRVYRIRHEGWSRIFPEAELASLSPLERELADRRAGEAWYAMRHMELVDLGYYLDGYYLEEGLRGGGAPSLARLAETAYNLADLASRLAGGNISNRPKARHRRVLLSAGEPIELGSRLAEYRSDRRAALAAAESELASAYRLAIKECNDGIGID